MSRLVRGLGRNAIACASLLLVSSAVAQAPSPVTQTIKHGDLVIATPWTREPPKGARVAGGFMRITNTGASSDRLIGGAAPFAKRFEVHEMAVVSGVMKMRELDKGLEIKPGETVELKPGGLHLMYIDITTPPAAGQTVKTTLRFERAGSIEIDVPVQTSAKGGGHSEHKH